jgi:hypothetical protein
MKLKDYLAQFAALDPEMEVFYRSVDDPYYISKTDQNELYYSIGYVSDPMFNNHGYCNKPHLNFTHKAIILK